MLSAQDFALRASLRYNATMTADLFGESEEHGMASKKPAPGAAQPKAGSDAAPRFEEAFERLGQVVDEMERGELPLEDMLKRFEEGVSLVKECRKFLEQAQLRVQQLVEQKDGRWVLKDLED